jgi:hypothetical protein
VLQSVGRIGTVTACAAAPEPALQYQPPAKDGRVSAPATAPLPGDWLLICCFMIAEGLNATTRRGEIGTSMPALDCGRHADSFCAP